MPLIKPLRNAQAALTDAQHALDQSISEIEADGGNSGPIFAILQTVEQAAGALLKLDAETERD